MAKLKIDVHDIHKYYGENEVLKGISTKFYEGDVVCIIGPSGSGKSTFLRSLNLLEEVTKGQITVNGYDLTDPKTNIDLVRENVGMVFQHFNLFPHMSVIENIMFAPLEHKRMSREEAKELAKQGMTMIIVTHEMGFARQVANRVIFTADGEFLEDGKPDQIFDNPQHPRLKEFLDKVLNV